MKLRIILSVAACKLSRFAIRLLGRGGTDLPGRIALKIHPSLLGVLAQGVKVVIVTGTNGKTTTSRMIERCLLEDGKTCIANKSGANLLSGITAEFAANASLSGEIKVEYAVIECDEAAFKQVSRFVDARVVLVTNVFRDQLDRYGEITHTLNNIKIGIENSPEAALCLNADCSLTASIALTAPNPVIFFGIDGEIYKERVEEVSDAPYCINCKTEYTYDYITFGHLGRYLCPNCGYKRPETDVTVTRVVETDTERSVIDLSIFGDTRRTAVGLPGGYNIYNAAAAASVAHTLGIDGERITDALSGFECGFGRMEKFSIGESELRMILIKNPAGCNQVLNFLCGLDKPALFVVCLNDRTADGTDISWIWDVDFERLGTIGETIGGIMVSGVRADDMTLRLHYAGIGADRLRVIYDYDKLIDEMLGWGGQVYIMPTYTAMLDLREKISRRFGFKDFWE